MGDVLVHGNPKHRSPLLPRHTSHEHCGDFPQVCMGLTVTILPHPHSSPGCHASHNRNMAFTNVTASQLRRVAHGAAPALLGSLCTLTSPWGLRSGSWPCPVTSSSYMATHPCLWDNQKLTLPHHLPFCFPQSF